MKIGIFGGSFNPMHSRHTTMIKQILDSELVNQVWVVPCKYHAFNKSLESDEDRINMIKLGIKNLKNVKLCDIELKSNGKNYTYNTIKKLKKKYKHDFYLIVGSDIPYEIHKWFKAKELFEEVKFIVLKRAGYKFKKVKGMEIVDFVREKVSGISSTEVRAKVKERKSLKNLVPKCIIDYIAKKGLYK